MMKYILLLFLCLTNFSYSKVHKDIQNMLPSYRYNLSLSMLEVGEHYEQLGQKNKAKRYFQTAYQIYPIRDHGHKLAQKLGINLDEKKVYDEFIKSGDAFFEQKLYQQALSNYLMAKEVKISISLSQKIADTYKALGDMENARFYQDLCQKDLNNPEISAPKEVNNEMFNQMLEEEYEDKNN